MQSIQQPISPEAITGFSRIGKHESFLILPDLNMVQQIRVVTMDENGQPLLEAIVGQTDLSDQKRQALTLRYADQVITRTTEGAYVSASGKVVEPTEPGAIPQREYFQAISIGDLKKQGMLIDDKTPVTSLIYAMVSQEITNIDNRGGL